MNNFITNIELKDKYIIITYYNEEIKRIHYNNLNRLEILKNIKSEKETLLKEKEYFTNAKLITIIAFFLQLTLYLLTNFFTNNLIFTIIISIFALELAVFNYSFYIYSKQKLKGIKELLNSLETNQLPNEEKYLKERKIINIEEYLKLKEQIEIYNLYDYDYPGKIYKKDFNSKDDIHGKILEFNLKDKK